MKLRTHGRSPEQMRQRPKNGPKLKVSRPERENEAPGHMSEALNVNLERLIKRKMKPRMHKQVFNWSPTLGGAGWQ